MVAYRRDLVLFYVCGAATSRGRAEVQQTGPMKMTNSRMILVRSVNCVNRLIPKFVDILNYQCDKLTHRYTHQLRPEVCVPPHEVYESS